MLKQDQEHFNEVMPVIVFIETVIKMFTIQFYSTNENITDSYL